jgi:hypothetical protein
MFLSEVRLAVWTTGFDAMHQQRGGCGQLNIVVQLASFRWMLIAVSALGYDQGVAFLPVPGQWNVTESARWNQ